MAVPNADWQQIKQAFVGAATNSGDAVCNPNYTGSEYCWIVNETCEQIAPKLPTLTYKFDTTDYTLSPQCYTKNENPG